MKGYDPNVIVQSGRGSPDGRDVRLGDLIAFPWHDPGVVPLKQRVGASRSLGPAARALGYPTTYGFHPETTKSAVRSRAELGGSIVVARRSPPPRPFRSRYEDGVRDVRGLYGAKFCEMITRLKANPTMMTAAAGQDAPPNSLDQLIATLAI
jgi:hypothetical protein